MAKQNVMINIDPETLKRFDRAIGEGNRSKAISKYMETYSLTVDDDVDGINAEILRTEILDLNRRISEIQAEREKKQSILDEYYRKRDKVEKKEMQMQKERLEAANKCVNCGSNVEDHAKTHKFPKGNVCHACFLAADAGSIKKWSEC